MVVRQRLAGSKGGAFRNLTKQARSWSVLKTVPS